MLQNARVADFTISELLRENQQEWGLKLPLPIQIRFKIYTKLALNTLDVKHHLEPFIVVVRISNTVPSENSTQPKECKQQDNEQRLNKCRGKNNVWAIRSTYRRQGKNQHLEVAKEK